MTPRVALIATLDTKGPEADFVRRVLERQGVAVRLIDAGCIGEPACAADVGRERVFEAAGTTLAEMLRRGDRGEAVTRAAQGVTRIVLEAFEAGELAGVLALGGSAGTTIGTAAMRALPIGVPKLMVSTLASGAVRQYVGDKDILMLNPVTDIAGLNPISRSVLTQAALAMAGLVAPKVQPLREEQERALIAATMFGVTTPCVLRAKAVLEEAGYEVLVFHATGAGGQAMESLIREGAFVGVLDLTTTELADELVGGVLSAGPTRLTAAAERGVPQVVSVGATDMVNFLGPETVPERFRGRILHRHNANVTLMRTSAEECAAIGRDLGSKLARAAGPVTILLPARGVSALDRAGAAFDDPAARRALFDAIAHTAGPVPVRELDQHVNDDTFAETAARALLELLATQPT